MAIKTLRRTIVRAVADPKSFSADVSKKLNPSRASSFLRSPSIEGLVDPGLPEDEVVHDLSLRDLIDETKSNMPIRLICTEDGKLYDRNSIEAWFRTEHPSFFEPTAAPADAETMLDTVKASFAYAMFSHRWGTVEPSYKDLDGSNVFSLPAECPGTTKLQHFCRQAREHGFRWAWSDTCCIDKGSTSELQKSIISMFKWYRNSAITLVYLGDVRDNLIEAFKKSVWFLRGWTLQELIAPRRLVFFQSDWSLLATSEDLPIYNYKASPTFRQLVTEITGIDDAALTHFDPTSRAITVRQRMSWAAHRKTTEVEDMAYCLMGIFNVHFPVMYGEGESAFNRLQNEIMAVSDDPSLFDWTGKPGSNSFLAKSAACFDPFAPPIVDPVPLTMLIADAVQKVPYAKQVQRSIDRFNVGWVNLQERLSVNVQHPANYIAGAKLHCHGFEYCVWDVAETKAMSNALKEGKGGFYQYHIISESLHPITVTLAEPIKTGAGFGRVQSKYLCMFRVWDGSLATGKSVTTVDDGNHPLRRPFVAHLLLSNEGGVYRRIQVKERIVAKLDNPFDPRMFLQLRTLMIE